MLVGRDGQQPYFDGHLLMCFQVICKHNSTKFTASKRFDEFVGSNAIQIGVLVVSSGSGCGVAG